MKLLYRRDLISGCKIFNPKKDIEERPKYALIPHFYTCPVLRKERRDWAIRNRG